jgi:HEAT repeat protein
MLKSIRSSEACLIIVALASRAVLAQEQTTVEEFDGWNLEPSVAQAHLVMVARVASISRVTVVEGAKTDVAIREYRFEPVKRLKGIFQRDQLSMTGSDLGIANEDASTASPLKEGEFRLLILTQQRFNAFGGISTFGCVTAAPGVTTFAERVPLVIGPDDPLVAVVETLIRVADSRSRRERATLLIDRLVDADGLAAVPLLSSLRLRADFAAADARAYAPLAQLVTSPHIAVRTSAIEVLRDMLASRNVPDNSKALDELTGPLRELIKSNEASTRIRVAALATMGNLLALNGGVKGARDLLAAQLNDAVTHAERAAAATALSQMSDLEALPPLLDAFDNLPLDEPPEREAIYARAILQFLPDEMRRRTIGDIPISESALVNRLERSIAARQSLEVEVDLLGKLKTQKSLPLMLAAAARHNLPPNDRMKIAIALSQLGDDRAVPVLISWLRDVEYLKDVALAALERIDSPLAAREVRPLLKTEEQLTYKLRIARLLARHGMDDGYSLATEHLADDGYTASAALVLAALDDPRTGKELSEIVSARPDRRWYAATLTGLAAIGDGDARTQLLRILANDRDPLVADAAQAAGLIGDGELLRPLARLVGSRNQQIARASLTAVRRFLSDVRSSPLGLGAVTYDEFDIEDFGVDPSPPPAIDITEATRTALAQAIASLVADAYVEVDVRNEAFAVARQLRGESYDELLSELADQAELEGTPLMGQVQAELRRVRDSGINP